jgi:phenylpropionate dioxygenase-like ring-hydroxylating dioxygenase large terminal subunit
LSRELARGQVIGRNFLDGRVIVWRGDDGAARVMSAFCPHVGADLSVGAVIGDRVQCAFHHWEYDGTGRCVKTGIGDPPPPKACLFAFPTRERYGLVWAFNGTEPLFELPSFAYPDDELVCKTIELTDMKLDPWVIMCNTPDLQHIKIVHGIVFDHPDPDEAIEWTPYSMRFDLKGTIGQGGPRIDYRVGIVGSNIFFRQGKIDGRFVGGMAPMGIIGRGELRNYLVAVTTNEGEDSAAFVDRMLNLSKAIISEDAPILNGIRFRQGTLTRSDKALARFLDYIRDYPRAHPSADYIR